jgi:hypothetical protein
MKQKQSWGAIDAETAFHCKRADEQLEIVRQWAARTIGLEEFVEWARHNNLRAADAVGHFLLSLDDAEGLLENMADNMNDPNGPDDPWIRRTT